MKHFALDKLTAKKKTVRNGFPQQVIAISPG